MKLCKKHDQLFKKEYSSQKKSEYQQIIDKIEKLEGSYKIKQNEIII